MLNGKQTSAGTFKTKKEALAAAVKAEEAQNAGGNPTFKDVAEQWLEWRRTAASEQTIRAVTMHLESRIYPTLGKKKIKSIQPVDIDQTISTLVQRGLAPSTIKQTVGTCRNVFKYGIDRLQIISRNPASSVMLPKAQQVEDTALTQDEAVKVLGALPDEWKPVMAALVYTGLRWGELKGLHWTDIDFDNELIHVRRSWEHVEKRFKSTKTNEVRSVPMNATIQALMKSMRDAKSDFPGEPPNLRYTVPVPDSGLVFHSNTNGILSERFRDVFNAAVSVAGIRRNVRVHDLRHTYASWLVIDGVPLEKIKGLLGHANMATTERYAHYRAKSHDEVKRALDGREIDLGLPAVREVEGMTFDDMGEYLTADEPDEDAYREELEYGPEYD